MRTGPARPPVSSRPQTLYEKLWTSHVVRPETPTTPAVLYVDLHLIHEVTSPQAFEALGRRGVRVRSPERTFATVDHSVPTVERSRPLPDAEAELQVASLEANVHAHGVPFAGLDSPDQGIVHVIGPETGRSRPGMTIVCGDSHTSTHGAFGALAFGIGTTEVAHVLATQSLLQRKAKTLRVAFDGRRAPGVTAKDCVLSMIRQIGVAGAHGYAVEYAGSAIGDMSMEERMTVCNMSVETSARAGMVSADAVTWEYLRPRVDGVVAWEPWATDPGARFDQEVGIDVDAIRPMITYGTHPDLSVAIDERIPDPSRAPNAAERERRDRALHYMGLEPGARLRGTRVHTVFIGSCTNGRLEDLRAAASILRGRRVFAGTSTIIVPGSARVRAAAEHEGLHHAFEAAGAEWRRPGCSMCIAMNGDRVAPGELAVSTSNRNFEGRQGPRARTLLASPLTAAATAVEGCVADPRAYMGGAA